MKYSWLTYSEQNDGGYCLPCVLFSRSAGNNADPGVLMTNHLTNLRKALETLEKYNAKDYHKEALIKMDAFCKVRRGQQLSICVQLNDAANAIVAKNRKKLQSFVETIILCGRQNIPLRGHHDGGLDLECNACESHGNSFALQQETLQDHLANAPRNATYTSLDIQNQVIDILGDYIQRILRIKKSQLFTLVADEVTDSSKKSNLVLC